MEDRERKKLSVLSEFLSRKVKDKGWSKKEFVEKAGLEETYVYKLLGSKRDFTPTEETLGKIAEVLEFSVEDRDFVFDTARRERESGSIIFSEEVPSEPAPEPAPSPSPEVPPSDDIPSETHPDQSPHPPEVPPSGGSSPQEPIPEPVPTPQFPVHSLWLELALWIKEHRLLIIVIGAVLLGLMMMSCCFLSGLL